MPVKIVTNSSADIPEELVKELDITVVPEYVIFGSKSYRDHIDMSTEIFYDKLVHGKIQPTTSNPNAQDFITAYNELGQSADAIVSIHISTKLSGTVNSAQQARKVTSAKCPIEIIDSQLVAIPLGLVVIHAARMAKEGKGCQEIVDSTREMLSRVHILVMFDTLTYLARGGRIGRAKSLVGAMLNVKPLLTLKNGEFTPVTQVRSKVKAKEKLLDFVKTFKDIEDLCVVYSSDKAEAAELAKEIEGFPPERIMLVRLGSVVGVHTGPGLLAVAVRTKN